jgi:hypothetical protein
LRIAFWVGAQIFQTRFYWLNHICFLSGILLTILLAKDPAPFYCLIASKILVYRFSDLIEIENDLTIAMDLLRRFAWSYDPQAPEHDQLIPQLLSEPRILEMIDRLRKNGRKSDQNRLGGNAVNHGRQDRD